MDTQKNEPSLLDAVDAARALPEPQRTEYLNGLRRHIELATDVVEHAIEELHPDVEEEEESPEASVTPEPPLHELRFDEALELARRRKGGWTSERVLRTIARAAEAVADEHDADWTRLVVTPQTLFVDDEDRVTVTGPGFPGRAEHDLGVDLQASGELALVARDGAFLQGAPYLAPERVESAPSPLADVYSLGAILYQALVRHPPYVPPGVALHEASILKVAVRRAPTPLSVLDPSLPGPLVELCERAMHRDRLMRPTSARELAKELTALLEDGIAGGVHPLPRSRSEARGGGGGLAMLGGAAAVFVAGAAIAYGMDVLPLPGAVHAAEPEARASIAMPARDVAERRAAETSVAAVDGTREAAPVESVESAAPPVTRATPLGESVAEPATEEAEEPVATPEPARPEPTPALAEATAPEETAPEADVVVAEELPTPVVSAIDAPAAPGDEVTPVEAASAPELSTGAPAAPDVTPTAEEAPLPAAPTTPTPDPDPAVGSPAESTASAPATATESASPEPAPAPRPESKPALEPALEPGLAFAFDDALRVRVLAAGGTPAVPLSEAPRFRADRRYALALGAEDLTAYAYLEVLAEPAADGPVQVHLDASDLAQAIARPPLRRDVTVAGRVVARLVAAPRLPLDDGLAVRFDLPQGMSVRDLAERDATSASNQLELELQKGERRMVEIRSGRSAVRAVIEATDESEASRFRSIVVDDLTPHDLRSQGSKSATASRRYGLVEKEPLVRLLLL